MSCSIEVLIFRSNTIGFVEQTFLYKTALAVWRDNVGSLFCRGRGESTIGQLRVKIDFCGLFILRTAIVTELKFYMQIDIDLLQV